MNAFIHRSGLHDGSHRLRSTVRALALAGLACGVFALAFALGKAGGRPAVSGSEASGLPPVPSAAVPGALGAAAPIDVASTARARARARAGGQPSAAGPAGAAALAEQSAGASPPPVAPPASAPGGQPGPVQPAAATVPTPTPAPSQRPAAAPPAAPAKPAPSPSPGGSPGRTQSGGGASFDNSG